MNSRHSSKCVSRFVHFAPRRSAFFLLMCWLSVGTAQAQYLPDRGAGNSGGGSFQDGEAVRESAHEIMSRPEFRHFRRLTTEKGFQLPFDPPFNNGANNPPDWRGDRDVNNDVNDQRARNQQPVFDEPARPQPEPAQQNWNQPRNNDGGQDFGDDMADAMPEWARDDGDWGGGNEAAAGSAAGGALGGLYTGFATLLLVVIVGLIGYAIAKSWGTGAKSIADGATAKSTTQQIMGDIEPDAAPGELPADVYIGEAEKLAAQGLFREAIAQLLLGAMSNVERSGLIRYRRGLTHRDYLRAIRLNEPLYASMKGMVRLYEPLGFGRRDATRKHFDLTLTGYETGFHGTAPVVNV